ncbi:hypothetical protein CHARACLAT_022365 [Characodon lateralis]|uniref:Uncharacterized protein n=1 Tax=Characodon lateralis TaxID=208331 RepID=A0ABU7D0I5_9TELE|nr:hypothetical protein [Characodon lateralis]
MNFLGVVSCFSLQLVAATSQTPKPCNTSSSVFPEIGCLPVTLTSYSPKSGWTTISTYNRVIGLSNPVDFIPPSFCDAAEIEKSAKPHTFFSAMESLAGMKVKSVE